LAIALSRKSVGRAAKASLLGAKIVSVRVVTSSSFTKLVAIKVEFNVSKPLIVEIVRKTSTEPGATVIIAVAVGVVVCMAVVATWVAVTTPVGAGTLGVVVTPVVPVTAPVVVLGVVAVVAVVAVMAGVFATVAVMGAVADVCVDAGVFTCPGLILQAAKSSALTKVSESRSATFFMRKPLI